MPPNILWIVLEDVSPRLGCYGDAVARTPRLDELAEAGCRYDRMFSTTGVCAPSRASLLTGMKPHSLGAQHMRTRVHDVPGLPDPYTCVPPHYVTAIPELLRHAGYFCTLDRKTDYQFGEPLTMWDAHGPGAGWWNNDRHPDQPFFAMMTSAVTHESGMWDPDDDTPVPEGRPVKKVETDPGAVSIPPYLVDTPGTRRAIARQYDNIAEVDTWIGSLLDRLDADGFAADTAVIVVGDHGEGLPRCKRWPYDSGTHVPLIIRWPENLGNHGSTRLISGIDIGPTTLSIANEMPPQYLDGTAFLGPYAEEPRTHLVTTRDRVDESYDMVRSVRGPRYRYVRHYYADKPFVQHVPYRDHHPAMKALYRNRVSNSLDKSAAQWLAAQRPPEELFDVQRDPHEMTNLATEEGYQSTLARMRSLLDEAEVDGMEETEEQMRRRMWPTGSRPTTHPPAVVDPLQQSNDVLVTEGPLAGPVTIGLYCPTQGASLTWALDDGPWRIYTGPITLSENTSIQVRTRAVRYGYSPSPVIEGTIEVQ